MGFCLQSSVEFDLRGRGVKFLLLWEGRVYSLQISPVFNYSSLCKFLRFFFHV